MSDIDVIVRMTEDEYRILKEFKGPMVWAEKIIKAGTPIPKGHGKIIDICKIDEDRIDDDNPVIQLTINGECIEAVSLDYINNLPTIIEMDKGVENEWIPCSERLPKEDGRYIITMDYSNPYINRDLGTGVEMAYFSTDLSSIGTHTFANERRPGWYDVDSEYGYYEVNGVLAWMPRPEPYKPES